MKKAKYLKDLCILRENNNEYMAQPIAIKQSERINIL